jgi:hypothetical protein
MRSFEEIDNQVLRMQRQLAALQKQVKQQASASAAASTRSASSLGAVNNFLRNGDLGWSKDNYENAVLAGGDTNKECEAFYTHAAGTTLLVEDSAHELSATGHTINNPAGAADPAWDKVNGWLQLGSDKSVDCPLLRKMAQASKLMYVGFIARKASSGIVIPAGLQLGLGLHDNTAGQRKYLEATQFQLTGTVVGVPGATTSRDYKVVATTDWGETYESNVVTVAGAPSDASYISNSVYVRLDWTSVTGVIQYDIYRKTGATYVLAGQIFNGFPGFLEQNNYLKSVAGYPAASSTNARAYVQIDIDDLTTDWQAYDTTIPVPATYDLSVTTDKQWLRFTLSQALAAGSERGVEMDKIWLSWNYGNFASSADDTNAQHDTDVTATSGSQGGAGTGGGGDPPDPGFGGLRCVWEEALVQVFDANGLIVEKPAREVTLSDFIVSFDDVGRPVPETIEEILYGFSSRLYTITAENGAQLPCSPSHPLVDSPTDKTGRPAALLCKGDKLLTFRPGDSHAQPSTVTAWEYIDGLFRVRIFRLRNRHLFVAGNLVSHNIKNDDF